MADDSQMQQDHMQPEKSEQDRNNNHQPGETDGQATAPDGFYKPFPHVPAPDSKYLAFIDEQAQSPSPMEGEATGQDESPRTYPKQKAVDHRDLMKTEEGREILGQGEVDDPLAPEQAGEPIEERGGTLPPYVASQPHKAEEEKMKPEEDKMSKEQEKPENVLEEIEIEHDEARELVAKIDEHEDLKDVKELYVVLFAHHRAEEEHVFPAVRKTNSEAEELVSDLLTEHDEAEAALKKMVESNTFDREVFEQVRADLDHHMEEEEGEMFDIAEDHLSEQELKALLDPFEETEEAAKEQAEKS